VKPGLLAALACAGCAPSADPYPVVAAAELIPLAADITGPIEILGANSAGSASGDFELRSVAAFHVRLPDAAPRRVVIYDAGSCDAPAAPPRVIADLQTIRTVGNETHFFANNLLVKGHRVDVDIETAQAELALKPGTFFYVLGKIAVVQAAPADGSPGTYLACGVFAATPGP
jgi:hypothetical protein